MSIENHCTDLKTSKRLKEIGLKQTAYFNWYDNPYSKVGGNKPFISEGWLERPEEAIASAFNLSELIEILGDKFYELVNDKEMFPKQWGAFYVPGNSVLEAIEIYEDTPIIAMSSLILKLHSEGVLIFKD